VALAAAGLAVVALRRQATRRTPGGDALPEDVHGLRQEVAALRAETGDALRHLAVVRYDEQKFLVGGTNQSIAMLAELASPSSLKPQRHLAADEANLEE